RSRRGVFWRRPRPTFPLLSVGRGRRIGWGHVDHDSPGRDLHVWNGGSREGQHHSVAASGWRDLQNSSSAEIINRYHDPDRLPGIILCSKPDQVGIVELLRLWSRQSLTRHIEVGVAQPLSGCTVSYALEASDQEILARPESLNFEGPHSIGCLQGAISCDGIRVRRERPPPDLACRTVCSPDSGNADSISRGFTARAPRSRGGRNGFDSLAHASFTQPASEPRLWPWRQPRLWPCALCEEALVPDCCARGACARLPRRGNARCDRTELLLWRASSWPYRDRI